MRNKFNLSKISHKLFNIFVCLGLIIIFLPLFQPKKEFAIDNIFDQSPPFPKPHNYIIAAKDSVKNVKTFRIVS